MLVLSAAEMQACDRATSEQYGMASVDLMRHARGFDCGPGSTAFPHQLVESPRYAAGATMAAMD